ncbi:head decoration protein [Cereibacter azotoformans]|uniref:Uncharacterized protein n=1 Tax=Cereibacter sphaeroides (strain ATCC 17025 / ATH 2.4.3) TaxID=349102 RepID=A4WNP9_CERS5|nr:head decoration protein [Cereibacter azotoformans]ULB08427.1 head decoration protein [Cereibacter azotoformans]
MTVFTEGKHACEGLLSEAPGQRSREAITIASGAGIIAPMTVLGRIAASGEYVPSPAAETEGLEGAEVAVAVNLYGCDATSAARTVAAIARDAEINAHFLTFSPSRLTDDLRAAAQADLAVSGIIVR